MDDDAQKAAAEKRPAMSAGRRGHHKADDPVTAGLRRMWADAEQEPVPDDLMALLDRIAAGSMSKSAPGQDDAS